MNFDLLGGSVLWRFIGRILDGIEASARRSATARLIANIRLWIQASAIVRVCSRIADRFGRSIKNSAIIARLLKEDEVGRYRERGLAFRGYLRSLALLQIFLICIRRK